MTVTKWSRRQILAGGAALGITLAYRPLAIAETPFESRETMPTRPGWNTSNGSGQPHYRIDGYAKVTGAKLYARDFRASDMEGWPATTAHAMLIFADNATHTYEGLDLTSLGDDLQPDRIVTATDLEDAGIVATGFFKSDLFCPPKTTPAYLGQPLAMLIYDQLAKFTSARQTLRGARTTAKYGEETGPLIADPYGANRFTRVAGSNPRGPDIYSPLKDGWVGPIRFQKSSNPVWTQPDKTGDSAQEASFYGDQIRKDLSDGKEGKRYAISFETQSIDQVFMEPEAGIAWHDLKNNSLSLVVGVQSPGITLESIGSLFSKAKSPYSIDTVEGHFAYLGGGFGGKDHTIVPLYIALAGMFGNGQPVRLALDRFDQFQFGLKRHAFSMKAQLGVNTTTRKFQAFTCDLDCDGGGLANFSDTVANVAATASTSVYYVPKSDITTVARHSRAVTAGSMRGFGTLQSMTAMECLVDEVATDLGVDPIELRRQNALKNGELNPTGNAASGALRTEEILSKLQASDIWSNRDKRKADFETANPQKAYGTGIACVMKDFGGGGDAAFSAISISPDGYISASASAIEMGNGISSSIAVRAAYHLGRNADSVQLFAEGLWDALKLETSGSPWSISQADQDAAAKNPRWTAQIYTPTSASIGAHVNTQAVNEAARVILQFGLWPAALAIWSEGPLNGQAAGQYITFDELRWVDGKLAGAGMQPLSLQALAKRAHEMGLVTGAMVHVFNRWSWATADFEIDGEPFNGTLDALAIQKGGQDWQLLDRTKVTFPSASFERVGVNYYSACGIVVALAVDKTNGTIAYQDIYQVLEAGTPIVPDIVSGVGEGGIAMGAGQALHEFLPLYEDGPGNGTWNLNRYRVPKAGDLPIWNTVMETLPPLSETDPPKGMAEVVMIPIVPGTLNALHDAIGQRFYKLPVTADDIMKVQ